MADVAFNVEFNEKPFLDALQAIEEGVVTVDQLMGQLGARGTKTFIEVANSTKGIDSRVKALADEMLRLSQSTEEAAESTEKLEKSQKGFLSGLANSIGGLKIGKKTLSDYYKQVKDTSSGLVDAAKKSKSLGTATKGVNAAFGVLKKLGVVGLITGIATAVLKSSKAMDFLKAGTSAVGAGFKTLVQNIENGDFKGLGRDIFNAAQAAFQAQKELQKLNKQLQQLQFNQVLVNGKVAEQQAIADDVTRSYAEREAAAQRAYELELEQLNALISNEFERFKQTSRIAGQEEAAAEANIRVQELFNQRAELQRRGARDIIRIQAERIDKIKEEETRVQALMKKYDALTASISNQARDARVAVLDELDQLFAQRDIAIAEVQAAAQKIRDFAKENDLAVPDDLDADVAAIIEAINAEFRKQVRDLQDKGEDPWSQILNPADGADVFDRAVRESVKKAGASVERGLRDDSNKFVESFQIFKMKILDALGLNEEQAAFVLDQFKSVFDSVAAITQANIQREIEQQDALIDARQKRVDELKDQLKEEQDAQKNGLANNVDQLQEALKQEQAVIQAAEQKRLQLEQEAARKRLIADSIQQASQISLAVAKLINAEVGSKGLPGIILAAAGIGLIFSIIAKAKAQAKSFSAVPKFREGTKFEGPSHEQGGIPLLVGSAQGYRAIEVEGGEHLIGTAPSREHDRFLTNLNARKYDGMPLYQIAEAARRSQVIPYARSVQKSSEAFAQARERRNFELMEKAFRDEIRALGDRFERQLNKMPTAFDPTRPVTFRFPNDDRKTERR